MHSTDDSSFSFVRVPSDGSYSVDALRARANDLRTRKLPRWVVFTAAIICLGVVGWALQTYGAAQRHSAEVDLPRITNSSSSFASPSSSVPTTGANQSPSSSSDNENVVVNVVGAVGAPGVYRLEKDARVDDAIRAAGGPTQEADLERVNRAQKLSDGAHVVILRKGQAMPTLPTSESTAGDGSGTGGTGGTVNINSADVKQLEALPGVGPATAQAIIAYRTSHGPFRSVEDLGNVKGIGPAKLEQMRSQATVS